MTIAEKPQLSTEIPSRAIFKEGLFDNSYGEVAMVFAKRVKTILFCLVLIPLHSYRPIFDLFAHIFLASESRSYDYTPFLRQAQDIASRLDLSKNFLQLFPNNLMIVALVLVISYSASFSQTITGNLSVVTNQEIKLEGFNGMQTYPIAKANIDAKGNFLLNYSKSDYGVGYLVSGDEKPFIVILSGEDIEIVGESLSYTETLKIVEGRENQWFEQYAKEHPGREQALNAWSYLEKMYTTDSLFSEQQTARKAIQNEKQRIKSADAAFLAKLPKDSYASWFLPARKLVSSVSTIARYRPEEIPETIAAFRSMDYTDQRLYKSGLFKDAIDNHYWLLENSGLSPDSVYMEMQLSIDAMMIDLVKDEKILNEVSDYLFTLLERHSLFQVSEYLSLKVLNEVSCTLENDLARQLETYRAMKKGNIAPDINLKGETFAPGYDTDNLPKKLSEIKSKYTVVIFGAHWCPKCTEDLPAVSKLYTKWKAQGIEVLFVSLNEDRETYRGFVKDFPFISTCDYKKWESPVVTDYYVFATPTIYLLDSRRKIVLKPNSVKQLDAWVDWYLVQGNKQNIHPSPRPNICHHLLPKHHQFYGHFHCFCRSTLRVVGRLRGNSAFSSPSVLRLHKASI